MKCTRLYTLDYCISYYLEIEIIKCDNNIYHSQKNTSRHGGKPLKVLVMHTAVVAHQIFAQKILSWLYTILGHSGMGNNVSFTLCSK